MTLPPLTIHPPGPPGRHKPHRLAGKRFSSLAEAEHRAARLARKAGCYRDVWAWPDPGQPVHLAEVYPKSVVRTAAGRDRAAQERSGP